MIKSRLVRGALAALGGIMQTIDYGVVAQTARDDVGKPRPQDDVIPRGDLGLHRPLDQRRNGQHFAAAGQMHTADAPAGNRHALLTARQGDDDLSVGARADAQIGQGDGLVKLKDIGVCLGATGVDRP